MTWYIKRKPEGKSFFRDAFPYYQCPAYGGQLWVQTRTEGSAFNSLEAARCELKQVRKLEPNAIIVRNLSF